MRCKALTLFYKVGREAMKKPHSNTKALKNVTVNDIFISSAWQQHIDVISHLCQFSQDMILATAPLGGGKTTFAHHFVRVATPKLQKVMIKAEKGSYLPHLFAQIMSAWGVVLDQEVDDIVAMQTQMENRFVEYPIPHVLLIDDAHLLDNQTLHELFKLFIVEYQTPPKPWHVMLLGEPSLELRLFAPEFGYLTQHGFYAIELEPWTLSDLTSYFEQLTFETINAEQTALIFERSHGLPGFVISEAQTLLTQSSPTGKKMKKIDMKRWCTRPVSIGVVLGLVIGTTYLLVNNLEEQGNTSIPINMAELAENEWENQDSSAKKSATVTYEFDKDEDVQVSVENDDEDEFLGAQALPDVEQKRDPSDHSKSIEEMHQDSAQSISENKAIEQNLASVKLPEETNQAATQISKHPALSAQEQHLLKSGANHYTIQLLGARSEDSIKQFIQRHAIETQTHYYRTQLRGKDWYVMVYGEFPTKESAKTAIEKMPSSLQNERLQPWIRELSHIQQEIREHQAA